MNLPPSLPAPVDDGAARHLFGRDLPAVALPSTTGLPAIPAAPGGRTVLYVYPRMAGPGEIIPEEWSAIPGARGCTPESCAFRDHANEMAALGARIEGLSIQSPEEQREAVERLHLPFPLFSDAHRSFSRSLELPEFEFGGRVFLRRFTLVVDDRRITHVFYPVFPADQHAEEVLGWLKVHPRAV